jgi:hypothetical protein
LEGPEILPINIIDAKRDSEEKPTNSGAKGFVRLYRYAIAKTHDEAMIADATTNLCFAPGVTGGRSLIARTGLHERCQRTSPLITKNPTLKKPKR